MTSLAARPVTPPNRFAQRVIVRTMNDFPPAVAGVITLEPNVQYNIVGVGITTANRFQCTGSVAIEGLWTFGVPQLIYTGTATMFTIIDGSFDVSNIFLDCASGTFLDMNSPTVFSGFKSSNVLINDCVKLGTIQNVQSVDAADNGCLQMNDGWTFNIPGGLGVLSIRQFNFGQMANGATAIDIGSSLLRTVELRDSA